jgi:site-specific DNA recombinase
MYYKKQAYLENIQLGHSHGWKVQEENNQIPLIRFVKCNTCGKFLRGYVVKKKGIFYYKCNIIGCG